MVLKKMKNNLTNWSINQPIIFITGLSLIFIIMRYSSDIIIPFLISISISIILSPLLRFFEKKGVKKIISLLLIIFISLIPIVILAGYIGQEAKDFSYNLTEYYSKFEHLISKVISFLNSFGIPIEQSNMEIFFAQSNIKEIIKSFASQIGTQFSNIFLIFFTVAFMLMESNLFYTKILKIAKDNNGNAEEIMLIIENIKSYFLIKVKTSFLTAVWVFSILWFYDINYFYLWVTLAFFLNFVPVIGSILAAVPTILMALIDQSGVTAMWVALWYIIINTVIGNILEPKIMGKGLGLSALIIFLSMTFWGWMFGPTGMILSVPLTMVIQFIFSKYSETKWISLLLSDFGENNKK